MTVDPWIADALAFATAAWQPGGPVDVLDHREVHPGEAWVCLRSGTAECVLGLRRCPDGDGNRTELLYAYPEPVAAADG